MVKAIIRKFSASLGPTNFLRNIYFPSELVFNFYKKTVPLRNQTNDLHYNGTFSYYLGSHFPIVSSFPVVDRALSSFIKNFDNLLYALSTDILLFFKT